jgi:hypothetical protein
MSTGDEEGMMIKTLFGSFDQALQVQIDGDTAKLTMSLSPEILQLIPNDLRSDLQDLSKKPLIMKKVNGEWLFDVDRSLNVTMDLGRPPLMTVPEAKEREVAVILAFAKSLDDIAARVDSGELESVVQTKRAIQQGVGQVLRQHGATQLNFSTTLAGDPAK